METDTPLWEIFRGQHKKPWLYVFDYDAPSSVEARNMGWYTVSHWDLEGECNTWMPLLYRCNAVLFHSTEFADNDEDHVAVRAFLAEVDKVFRGDLRILQYLPHTLPTADEYYEEDRPE